MPIYEYECEKCHEITELMQKMSDLGPEKCPNCGSKKMKRVMSQTSFQLKGEGWYITDYSRKDKEQKAAAKTKPAAESDSGSAAPTPPSETKADAKAEPKSEAKLESKAEPKSASKTASKSVTNPATKKKSAGKRG